MNRGGARRGHLSTKVPGARNRPAPLKEDEPESDLYSERRAVLAASESESEPEPEPEPPAVAAGPLAGLMIAFTGIPAAEKSELVGHAEALGAETQPDLTMAATHLVSLQVGSTKYRQAILHGMTVVQPEWIRSVMLNWVEGTACDAIQMAESFPLAPMQGLRTALATKGTENDPGVREALKQVQSLGASCTLLTEAPLRSKTTHIIFLDTESAYVRAIQTKLRDSESQGRTSQMSAGSHRRSMVDLKFVRWEWVADCERAKLCIAEDLYDPLRNAPQREREKHVQNYLSCRVNAKNRLLKERARHGLRSDALLITQRSNTRQATRRPRLVDSIVQATTAPVEPTRPASKWEDDERAPKRGENSTYVFKRGSSLRKENDSYVDSCGSSIATSPAVLAPGSEYGPTGRSFLDGVRIRVDSQVENRDQVIELCVRQGAHMMSPAEQVEFTIVPMTYPHTAGALDGTLVTSLWLEECSNVGRRVGVQEQFFFVPTKVVFPLEGSVSVVLHSTGLPLTGPVRYHIGNIAKRMGVQVATALSRACTHLLVGPENPAAAKISMAKRVEAHAVDLTFLQRMYEQGKIDPLPTPRLAPKRSSSQFTASQAPSPTALPSTYVPGRMAPLPQGLAPPIHGRSLHPDPMVSQLRHVLLSDGKNRLVGGSRRPRAPVPLTRASTSPRPQIGSPSVSKPVPFPEPEPSPEECPAQTQAIMSYDDPRGRRERERLDALISGEAPPKPRSSAEIRMPPSAANRVGRRAHTDDPEVVDVTSSLPKRPRRH